MGGFWAKYLVHFLSHTPTLCICWGAAYHLWSRTRHSVCVYSGSGWKGAHAQRDGEPPRVLEFEKLLYFGFGARSFLHVMADAQSGVNCIALCSALSEVHNEHAAAWILDELWKLYDYPPQFLPSHSQLTAFVKACPGVLSRTEFSHVSGRMLGHNLQIKPFDISNIEHIAKALRRSRLYNSPVQPTLFAKMIKM